jgi:hypothetical protein
MSIDPRCLHLLQTIPGLGLPLTVSGVDRHGVAFSAAIDTRGTVSCRGQSYGCPSALRAALIQSNGPTYPRLFYNGRSLRQWGVQR